MTMSAPPSGPMVIFTLPVPSTLTVVVMATSWPFQLIVLAAGAVASAFEYTSRTRPRARRSPSR